MNPRTQREQDEIDYLERLYALGANDMNIENERLNSLAAGALQEVELAAARQGKDSLGAWCFGCGHSVPTAECTCPYPESFNCGGHRFCSRCVEAHRKIAQHLHTMFAARISRRVSSIRSRKYNQIARAADSDGLSRGRALRTALFKYADPDVDEPEDFVKNTLSAFRRSGFFDFATLAAAIEREENECLVLRIVKSGVLG
jgi:hypothetical protein